MDLKVRFKKVVNVAVKAGALQVIEEVLDIVRSKLNSQAMVISNQRGVVR